MTSGTPVLGIIGNAGEHVHPDFVPRYKIRIHVYLDNGTASFWEVPIVPNGVDMIKTPFSNKKWVGDVWCWGTLHVVREYSLFPNSTQHKCTLYQLFCSKKKLLKTLQYCSAQVT